MLSNMNEQPSEPPKVEAHPVQPTRSEKPSSGVLENLDKHGPKIHTVSAVIGVFIAALMLWSIVISRRQFESSIDPRLDVSCQELSFSLRASAKTRTN